MSLEEREARRLRLLEEANALPPVPGVYIMHDVTDKIIYVGKSRRLCDRVSQYFRNTEKNAKTEKMASSVYRFEYVVCSNEIEALTLENVLIKEHTPKYNIRLKDAKSYPYIKLTPGEYPRPVMSRSRKDDGGIYFGPYSGTASVFSVISTVNRIFGLPSCSRKFPRDIGKDRPCIYYRMGRCMGVCTGNVSADEYRRTVSEVGEFLRGHTGKVKKELEARMMSFAEGEMYEAAAKCRDAIKSIDMLSQKQKAVTAPDEDRDVAGIFTDDSGAAMTLLRIRGGAIVAKLDFNADTSVADYAQAFSSVLAEHYSSSGDIPGKLLLGDGFDADEGALLGEFLSGAAGKKIPVTFPEKGEGRRLCEMAAENACQALRREKEAREKDEQTEVILSSMLGLEQLPERIEAYDISNIGSEHITAGMIVSVNGRFVKKDYRSFTIKTTAGIDDYGALREALTRRFTHLKNNDPGFSTPPDLILLDGGEGHLSVGLEVMNDLGLSIPMAGMVKDDSHRTRALITPDGECDIAAERSVFVLIYRIQEEVHRYSVGRMTAAKRRTLKHSSLEKIDGIGPGKAEALMKHFGTVAALKNANPSELSAVKGITAANAAAIKEYFAEKQREED